MSWERKGAGGREKADGRGTANKAGRVERESESGIELRLYQ